MLNGAWSQKSADSHAPSVRCSWFGFLTEDKQALHPSEDGELSKDLSANDKAMTCPSRWPPQVIIEAKYANKLPPRRYHFLSTHLYKFYVKLTLL